MRKATRCFATAGWSIILIHSLQQRAALDTTQPLKVPPCPQTAQPVTGLAGSSLPSKNVACSPADRFQPPLCFSHKRTIGRYPTRQALCGEGGNRASHPIPTTTAAIPLRSCQPLTPGGRIGRPALVLHATSNARVRSSSGRACDPRSNTFARTPRFAKQPSFKTDLVRHHAGSPTGGEVGGPVLLSDTALHPIQREPAYPPLTVVQRSEVTHLVVHYHRFAFRATVCPRRHPADSRNRSKESTAGTQESLCDLPKMLGQGLAGDRGVALGALATESILGFR